MGRSDPSFFVEDCTNNGPDRNYGNPFISDFTDETSIRNAARAIKRRNLGCWKHEGFKLPAPGETSDKFFHFLEYSGTRQAAEDIERMRKLFGDQKLSLYGISYGTKVTGTYATLYPDNVNLMVLDGSDDPDVDIAENVEDIARSLDQRIDYFISACSADSLGEEGEKPCGIEDAGGCVNDLNDFFRANFNDFEVGEREPHNLMQTALGWLYGNVMRARDLCQIADAGDVAGFQTYYCRRRPGKCNRRRKMQDEQEPSQPSYQEKPIYNNTNYQAIAAAGNMPQNIVTAQDYIFGAYREDFFVKTLMDLNVKYPGAGTQTPVDKAYFWYAACYHWPISTPLPPLGHPGVSGVIAGQIWDPYTPYIWTQKMRENFPAATLLTSRSYDHGISGTWDGPDYGLLDPECQDHVDRYFKTGRVDFSDGATCMSRPLGDHCDIQQIVDGETCVSTPSPTYFPTESPVTPSPTYSQTESPVTPSPTYFPTESPVTASPTYLPTEAD